MRFVLYNQWERLPKSAETLFSQAEQSSFFNSRIWLESLSTYALTEQQSLLLACVVEDESVLAILPLLNHTQGGLSALSNHYNTLYTLLITNHSEQDNVLRCLADGLSDRLAQSAHQAIQLEPVDAEDGLLLQFWQVMESKGFQRYPYFRFYNWVHQVQEQSFDQYMADRPAKLRNTIIRKRRKLEREHGYDIRLYKDADTDISLLNQAMSDYHSIIETSWKTSDLFAHFTPELVKKMSQRGWLRLAILYTHNQPIAAQIWFVLHKKANIYRLAYDPDWKKYSPGSILTEYLMHYVIDTDKVTEIDFLTGNERYKQDWMTIRRERLGVRLAKPLKNNNNLIRKLYLRIMQYLK